ncbi:MAG: UDP-N-acetylgalactosamine-undecaprenyl-phosphate N-acetylgalactosaminephosphotransferase [SAR116 cluster bacterium MED-G04]|nr:MAG: UDP-N-acetylgalactosamine-undecaprenyl-phosphate N-acetylgalactosaminephosphotransferase [SAR116 cluster bacterium MED-G04]
MAESAIRHEVYRQNTLRGAGLRGVLAASALIMMTISMVLSGWALQGQWLVDLPMTIYVSGLFLTIGFSISLFALLRLSRISVWNMTNQVLPVWFTISVISMLMMLGLRLSYSTVFLVINWTSAFILLMAFVYMIRRFSVIRAGVLEGINLPDGGQSRQDYLIRPGETLPLPLDAVVATPQQMEDEHFIALLTDMAINKIPVIPDHVFMEAITGRMDLKHTDASTLMQLVPWRRYALLKRLGDIAMASIGIVVLSPVMLLLYGLIRLESPGNPIFVQKRVGAGGGEFTMYKFRSMVASAEGDGAKFASQNDNRITRLGAIMRKTRLDELPQLFNVLAGSMSMIGPRPEQKALVDDLAAAIPLYRFRHVIRPGITGWAQVMQGYADDVASTDVKLSYDLFYIKNLSLMMDFVIFFKTLKTIITGFGSR